MSNEPKSAQAVAARKGRPPKRAMQIGVVTSSARQKTIRVTVPYKVRHEKYGKYLKRETSLQVHDEKDECRNGDIVEVMQCRPLSKTKCWRLVRVIKRAPQQVLAPAAPSGPPPEVQP